jgi:hypothetical protein
LIILIPGEKDIRAKVAGYERYKHVSQAKERPKDHVMLHYVQKSLVMAENMSLVSVACQSETSGGSLIEIQ